MQAEAVVIGIGNVLWADEGFGIRALEALHADWELPEGIELVDGGTQGLVLLEPVTSARHVLVFDALDFGLPPGTLRILRDREVPAWAGKKMSLHQQSFQELLAVCDLQGRFPPALTLIGVQPDCLSDFGGSLSAPVRAQLQPAVAAAVEELQRWGIEVKRREGEAERLNAAALDLSIYETGRPSADEACRIGDARFLEIRRNAERTGGR